MISRVDWRESPEANENPGLLFLSASLDETIRIWHLEKPEPVCILKLQKVM